MPGLSSQSARSSVRLLARHLPDNVLRLSTELKDSRDDFLEENGEGRAEGSEVEGEDRVLPGGVVLPSTFWGKRSAQRKGLVGAGGVCWRSDMFPNIALRLATMEREEGGVVRTDSRDH